MRRLAGLILATLFLFIVLPQNTPARPPAAAGVTAYKAAEVVGGYIIGKAVLDPLFERGFGPDGVVELQQQLLVFETMLRLIDPVRADDIAKFRSALNTKTKQDDVRRIVNEALTSLRSRVKEIEGRLTDAEKRTETLEKRVAAIEELFGKITYFPPTPLVMRDGIDGKPTPHPRVKEWITLLVKSEESRIKLIELRRDLEDTTEEVKKARAEDAKIVAQSQALHKKALEEVSDGLVMISAFKAGSPKRLPTEAKVAGLMWLVAVTKPIGEGEWKGRLGVPAALFGSQACEISEAFELSGVETDAVVGLYRRALAVESLRKPRYLGDGELLRNLRQMGRKTREIDVRHKATAKEYGAKHEKMIAVEKEKRAQIAEMKAMPDKIEKELTARVREYVKGLQGGERPTNAKMMDLRNGVLSPLFAWREAIICADAEWKDAALAGETWARVCRA
jgi:hypothetical protein